MKSLLFLYALSCISINAVNLSGYDYERGNFVDIEADIADLQEGRTVDYYEYSGNGYGYMTINSVGGNEIEGTDDITEETFKVEIS